MMNSKVSGAVGGAAQGAAIGSTLGPVGTGVGAVLGGLVGLFGGGDEDDAKRLAEIQADLIERAGVETTRRMTAELDRGMGSIRASVGASNLQFSGSARRYYDEFEAEGLRQIKWERTKAGLEAEAARMGGQVAAREIQSLGMANMLSGLSYAANNDLFGSYSKSTGYQKPQWLG